MMRKAETTPESELLAALKSAIMALNQPRNFDTKLQDPDRPGRTLKSYDLIPRLEKVVRKYEP